MSTPALVDIFGLVGTTLEGQYRVDKVVGEGGFGVVYKGFHIGLGQPIAIKALKILTDDPKAHQILLQRFREEARLLYTLSQASLHIVRSIDFGATQTPSGAWAPFMVLEWLEGQSLADDLDRRRANGMRGRSFDEVMTLLAPAAEGLIVAHQHRIVHRDVKPANFFLLAGQSTVGMKVLDFGIAKILRDEDQQGTRGTLASFTWLYAAPEQLDNRYGQSGLATDVYSFGLVMTELLSDRLAVTAQDPLGVMKIATDPTVRPTPRSRGINVTDSVEIVLRRALAVEPSKRYANMADMWNALQAARIDDTKQSPQGQLTPRAQPPMSAPPMQTMQAAPLPQPTRPSMPQQSAPPAYGPPPPQYYAPPVAGPMMVPPRQSQIVQPQSSNGAIIAAVIALAVGTLFVGSCALVHACLK